MGGVRPDPGDRWASETTLHFPTRGRNLLRVQGDLLAAHALGMRNVFVVMGDPTAIGDYPEAMDNYDLVPSGLIKLIKEGFNAGVDHAGTTSASRRPSSWAARSTCARKDVGREIKVVRRKVLGRGLLPDAAHLPCGGRRDFCESTSQYTAR